MYECKEVGAFKKTWNCMNIALSSSLLLLVCCKEENGHSY